MVKDKISPNNMNNDNISILIEFDDNLLLPELYGEHNRNLIKLEKLLNISIITRGNKVMLNGNNNDIAIVKIALEQLYRRLKNDEFIENADIDAAVRMAQPAKINPAKINSEKKSSKKNQAIKKHIIRTPRKQLTARTILQSEYIDAINHQYLTFAIGPAGTGKTYLAVCQAVSMLMSGQVEKIILSRPAVEAGENLGFLPGDLKEKVDPYLRPIYDALYDTMPDEQVARKIESDIIEIAPLAFMRGRSLKNAFILLDEGQNTTTVQMKMFLTRLGEGSRMVVTGDLSQVDLPKGQKSGMAEAVEILSDIDDISIIRFSSADVVRHPLVSKIVDAYDRYDENSYNG